MRQLKEVKIAATPKNIESFFADGYIKLQNGNFFVAKVLYMKKYITFEKEEECKLVGLECEPEEVCRYAHYEMQPFINYPEHFAKIFNASDAIYIADIINKQIQGQVTKKEDEKKYEVHYNLHKDNSWIANLYETLEDAYIGIRLLQADDYKPRLQRGK